MLRPWHPVLQRSLRCSYTALHHRNVTGAQRELLKYYASITSNRWLMLKIFGVLIIFVSQAFLEIFTRRQGRRLIVIYTASVLADSSRNRIFSTQFLVFILVS